MSKIEYVITIDGKVVRLGVPCRIVGSIDTSSGFIQSPVSEKIKQLETFEEICLFDNSKQNYVYFKSSKVLRLHNISFMITLFNEKTDKFKFSLAFEKYGKVELKDFTINNLPFEIKREYFVNDVEDAEKLKRDIKNRVLFEYRDTKNKLNGMSVFK